VLHGAGKPVPWNTYLEDNSWWSMRTFRRSEAGETLLEIIMALVVIGLVVSAYFATFSTQSSGSTAQRNLVTADGLLRDAAEGTKSAVRMDCGSSTTFTTTTVSLPTDFGIASSTDQCPTNPETPSPVDIAVGTPKATPPIVADCSQPSQPPGVVCLSIVVRTP
jgi:hypothetical protein